MEVKWIRRKVFGKGYQDREKRKVNENIEKRYLIEEKVKDRNEGRRKKKILK